MISEPTFFSFSSLENSSELYTQVDSPLHEAILSKDKRVCRKALKSSCVNEKDSGGDTSLHLAIRTNWDYAVDKLLKKSPRLLIEDKNAKTALELAEELDLRDFVHSLLRRVAHLDEAIPQPRQCRFLASIWFQGNARLITLVAKRYLPKRKILSYPQKEWDRFLYHVVGKKAFLFTKDRAHLHSGTLETKLYPLLLWTWNVFCQKNGTLENPRFARIASAIQNSLSRRSAKHIAQEIRTGSHPSLIYCGWKRHSVTVVFVNSLLFICNRGGSSKLKRYSLTAYRIDKSLVTERLIRTLRKNEHLPHEISAKFIYETLPSALNGYEDDFCAKVHQLCQPSELSKPICVAANLRQAIYAMLLGESIKENGSWNFMPASGTYKEYVNCARFAVLNQYLLA